MKRVDLHSRNFSAFLAVARHQHFGKAADALCITSSALSQRIATLEEQLQTRLFHRNNNAVTLTEIGQRLLRYGQTTETLQSELLQELLGAHQVSGTITVASFSSVARSVLLPALRALQFANPGLIVHIRVAHMYELTEILARGQADFIVSQDPLTRSGYESLLLGEEHNVLVEAVSEPRQDEVYLDHNQADDFTERFLLRHDARAVQLIRRRFCDDIYGILDAASLGLGRGVVPVHMLSPEMGLRLVPGYERCWATPVLLHYPSREYYPASFLAVRDALRDGARPLLSSNRCGLVYQALD